jgi:hypothetical protein
MTSRVPLELSRAQVRRLIWLVTLEAGRRYEYDGLVRGGAELEYLLELEHALKAALKVPAPGGRLSRAWRAVRGLAAHWRV